MIPIPHKYNKRLPEYHTQALEKYLSRETMEKKFKILDDFIRHVTNNKYDFKKLASAPFHLIESDIIPLWESYDNPNVTQHVDHNKAVKLFKTLYSYLGKSEHYYFEADGKKINYNTEYIFRELNIQVCPFCNENHTYHINKGKRNYDIDHFYGKEKYPITAVCFYNLVPCCKVCNFFKSDKNDTLLSPFENYQINQLWNCILKVQSSDFLFDKNQLEIESSYDEEGPHYNKIKNNISLFKIIERYNERKDIVIDVLKKKQLYDSVYIEELYKEYKGVLFNSPDEMRHLIFGASLMENDYHQKGFSKLISDISSINNSEID